MNVQKDEILEKPMDWTEKIDINDVLKIIHSDSEGKEYHRARVVRIDDHYYCLHPEGQANFKEIAEAKQTIALFSVGRTLYGFDCVIKTFSSEPQPELVIQKPTKSWEIKEREFPRMKIDKEIDFQLVDIVKGRYKVQGKPISATLFDVSQGGIGFVTHHRMASQQIIYIEMRLDHKVLKIYCDLCNEHVLSRTKPEYRYGGRIIKPSKEVEQEIKAYILKQF